MRLLRAVVVERTVGVYLSIEGAAGVIGHAEDYLVRVLLPSRKRERERPVRLGADQLAADRRADLLVAVGLSHDLRDEVVALPRLRPFVGLLRDARAHDAAGGRAAAIVLHSRRLVAVEPVQVDLKHRAVDS